MQLKSFRQGYEQERGKRLFFCEDFAINEGRLPDTLRDLFRPLLRTIILRGRAGRAITELGGDLVRERCPALYNES